MWDFCSSEIDTRDVLLTKIPIHKLKICVGLIVIIAIILIAYRVYASEHVRYGGNLQVLSLPAIKEALSTRLSSVFKPTNPLDDWITRKDVWNAISVKIDRQLLVNLSREYVERNEDFSIKPWQIQPLPEYTSHCWAEVEGVRCLASFYLAGMMKCGTTDLWYHIIKHPQIIDQYYNKEPLWWDQNRIRSDRSILGENGVKFTTNTREFYKIYMKEYTDNFGKGEKHLNPDVHMGDASGTTMWNNIVMRDFIKLSQWTKQPSPSLQNALNDLRIQPAYLAYQYTPNAKFLVILRDPGERMYSQFLFGYYRNLKNKVKPTKSAFHNWVVDGIKKYRDCLGQDRGVRFCAYDRISHAVPLGFYIIFITDLLRVVPRENVLILNFEEYRKDRGVTLERIYQFLGIAHDEKTMLKTKSGKVANSRKDQHTDIGPMWNETRQILKDLYRPFNQELAKFLNDENFLFD